MALSRGIPFLARAMFNTIPYNNAFTAMQLALCFCTLIADFFAITKGKAGLCSVFVLVNETVQCSFLPALSQGLDNP